METQKVHSDRRDFLKKAAYVAPAIVALGSLNAHAVTDGSGLGNGNANRQAQVHANSNATIKKDKNK